MKQDARIGNHFARTHGQSNTGTYRAWSEAKQRCGNHGNQRWADYGGRGIVMCDRWRENFPAFLADMGVRPAGLTLERKDNDGPYSPENCCWATYNTQGANTRKKRLLTCNGKTQHMSQWARELGTRPVVIYLRLSRGWTIENAVTVPVRHS